MTLVMRRTAAPGRTSTVRQTASRTVDRIHLMGTEGREWLFERNPVDPRRVSATMVEHASKTIVLYGDSDLQMVLGIRGWSDILMFGFDGTLVRRCGTDAVARTIGPNRFVKCTVTGASAGKTQLWWSDAQLLATPFVLGGDADGTVVTIETMHAGVENARLAPATSRFPHYRVHDYADWLEDNDGR